jgi:HD superfamily phosphohydrolase
VAEPTESNAHAKASMPADSTLEGGSTLFPLNHEGTSPRNDQENQPSGGPGGQDPYAGEAATAMGEAQIPSLQDANSEGSKREAPGEVPSLPDRLQEFHIPVSEHVRLSPSELLIVDHPAFARLADIYQLGQTHVVYRGATHRRFEHALGTLHMAQLMIEAIERNYRNTQAKGSSAWNGEWKLSEPLRPHETAFVRLGALLHDIGHLPAGHTLEDELGLLDRHDEDPRISYVLARRTWRGTDETRTLEELVNEQYAAYAEATATHQPASEILLDLISSSKDRDARKPVEGSQFRLRLCRDLIGNTICADLLDYLHRDWHHIGKPRWFDARILDYLEVRHHKDESWLEARLVINVRSGHDVRPDAVTAIFDLLESRYQLGEIALFHRTKLCAAGMLERLVAEVGDASGDPQWFNGQLDRLLECSDEELLSFLEAEGRRIASQAGQAPARRLNEVRPLARKLRYRQLHKQIYARYAYNLPGRVDAVRGRYGGAAGAQNRLATLRSLEEDFDLPTGSLVMYCPERAAVHAKVADVQVLVHEEVDTLAELERRRVDPALTGGYLEAQQSRFERLWRIVFAIDPAQRDELDRRGTRRDLERAIRALVLGDIDGTATLEGEARDIASKLVANPLSHVHDKPLVPAGEQHAKAERRTFYATGAPTISSLILE